MLADKAYVFSADEQVLVEWSLWATGKTGRPHDQKNIGVFIVRDGKIVEMRVYADIQNWERTLTRSQT